MSHKLAISTMSLGRAWTHQLVPKLTQAAEHGYSGIELFFEDLEYHAREHFGGTDPPALSRAAKDVRAHCARLRLSIVCLQPLMHYEGLDDALAVDQAYERAMLFFSLANDLVTDLILIPSNFLPADELRGDLRYTVEAFQQLAVVAGQQSLRLAFEALCWGTHIDIWEASWEVVQQVGMPNFGLALDTFNIAGRVYADPAAASGIQPAARAAVSASMQRLVATVDARRVFLLQVVDAARLAAPLVPGHALHRADQPARMSWSRNCRLFYGESERGAYLPIRDICEAIINGLGYKGWITMELFSLSMSEAGPAVPAEHALRGAVAWRKLVRDMHLDDGSPAAPPARQPSEAR